MIKEKQSQDVKQLEKEHPEAFAIYKKYNRAEKWRGAFDIDIDFDDFDLGASPLTATPGITEIAPSNPGDSSPSPDIQTPTFRHVPTTDRKLDE